MIPATSSFFQPLHELRDIRGSLVIKNHAGRSRPAFSVPPAGQAMLNDMGTGEAVLDADFIALEDDVLVDRFILGARRMNDQVHGASLWAADHRNDVPQFHVNRIDRFVGTLADRENPVARLELLVEIGRASRDDFLDRSVTVIRAENGPRYR